MKERNNKYDDWSHTCMALTIALFMLGMVLRGSGTDKYSSYVGAVSLIAGVFSFIAMIIFSVKDTKVNREFDKQEEEKGKYEEYLRLKQKYDGKNDNGS